MGKSVAKTANGQELKYWRLNYSVSNLISLVSVFHYLAVALSLYDVLT